MFLGFFPFYFGGFSILVRHLQKDTVRMIFPFFPFLFWRFWVCEGNTLMGYCRNDFSLFFPFSVFPSKSFLFIFLFCIYFCVVVVSIRRKKNKKILLGGKKGKREKYSQEIQQTPLFYTENVKIGFFPFFSVFPFFIREIFFQ